MVQLLQTLPPPGGGVTDHGALAGLGDDDHTQYGHLSQAETVAALWTFNAGVQLAAGQAIKDSGGTDRVAPAAASPHLTLTGDVQVNSGQISVGEAPTGNRGINVAPNFGTVTAGVIALRVQPPAVIFGANGLSFTAIAGVPQINIGSGYTNLTTEALNFTLGVLGGNGSNTMTRIAPLHLATLLNSLNAAVTDFYAGGLIQSPLILAPGASLAITNTYGLHIQDVGRNSKQSNVYSLKIDDQGTTPTGNQYLVEVGPSSPNLRVEIGNPSNPGASLGRSQILSTFNENGTLNLRRLEWKDFSNLVAGDQVMVAV